MRDKNREWPGGSEIKLQELGIMYRSGHRCRIDIDTSIFYKPGRVAQSVGYPTHKSGVLGSIPGLAGKLSFLLPLFQEGQLSVTGESMCTKYWLTA